MAGLPLDVCFVYAPLRWRLLRDSCFRKGLHGGYPHILDNLGSIAPQVDWSCLEEHSVGSAYRFHHLLRPPRCTALPLLLHARQFQGILVRTNSHPNSRCLCGNHDFYGHIAVLDGASDAIYDLPRLVWQGVSADRDVRRLLRTLHGTTSTTRRHSIRLWFVSERAILVGSGCDCVLRDPLRERTSA